ncbi:hypothetical protein SAMN04488556_1103 [Halostagnicola kamekurae]|uniref:Uncharacterized protein n=2 Tax=Halostagnicola kamekurae TaxID=619731 RepID=A0A1I6Q9Q4_9EURY|nr:hypothetical protein SAMN04488556_1103 [Halostagnicola kamekurae]
MVDRRTAQTGACEGIRLYAADGLNDFQTKLKVEYSISLSVSSTRTRPYPNGLWALSFIELRLSRHQKGYVLAFTISTMIESLTGSPVLLGLTLLAGLMVVIVAVKIAIKLAVRVGIVAAIILAAYYTAGHLGVV